MKTQKVNVPLEYFSKRDYGQHIEKLVKGCPLQNCFVSHFVVHSVVTIPLSPKFKHRILGAIKWNL